MAGRLIKETSGQLVAVARVNGTRRCSVHVYVKPDEQQPVATEFVDLARRAERTGLVEGLPAEHQTEADALLQRLAAGVEAERIAQPAKGKKGDAKDAPSAPPLEPWEDPVDGAAILDELRAVLLQYLILPPSAAEAIALWIVHTYLWAAFDFTPYLLVTSPVRECGKSTLLDLLEHLAYRAKAIGGYTAAALYRSIERDRPTLLLDELDTRLRGDSGEAIRGVLNCGFQRGRNITICVGDDHDARDFPTYCPKVLAGIGRVWDTVTSRSIPIRLARASKEEIGQLRKVRGDRIETELLPFRRQILRWATDVEPLLADQEPTVPEELGARQADIWRPLLTIADLAGGDWPDQARAAARALHRVAEEEGDLGLLMLADVRQVFEDEQRPIFLRTARILEVLHDREERPWPDYHGRGPIKATEVSRLLGRFDVKPYQQRAPGEPRPVRGYRYSDLAPIFARYLPQPQQVTSQEASATEPAVTGVTGNRAVCGASTFDDRGEAWEPDESQIDALESEP